MSTGIKIGVSLYITNLAQEGIVLCGCFPSKTYAAIFLIVPVRERPMTLLLFLNPTSFSQVARSRIIDVFHKFAKILVVTAIKSKQYAPAKLRGIIDALGLL